MLLKSLRPYIYIYIYMFHGGGSILAQVMACRRQSWLIISEVQSNSSEGNSLEIAQTTITRINLEITYLRFHSNPPAANLSHFSVNKWCKNQCVLCFLKWNQHKGKILYISVFITQVSFIVIFCGNYIIKHCIYEFRYFLHHSPFEVIET